MPRPSLIQRHFHRQGDPQPLRVGVLPWGYDLREVIVPRGWSDQRYLVRIESATHHGRIYVKDELVADRQDGYTPFEADIMSHISADERFPLTTGVNSQHMHGIILPGSIGHLNVSASACRNTGMTSTTMLVLRDRSRSTPCPRVKTLSWPRMSTATVECSTTPNSTTGKAKSTSTTKTAGKLPQHPKPTAQPPFLPSNAGSPAELISTNSPSA
ncbi:hypothetical protein BDW75DRAFT_240317 [Aspergillus navahoensis]